MLYLQNTFCSMLLFYKCAVHKLCDHVGDWDTEICIWNSWQAAPAFLLILLLLFILETTILLFHVIAFLCYFWS